MVGEYCKYDFYVEFIKIYYFYKSSIVEICKVICKFKCLFVEGVVIFYGFWKCDVLQGFCKVSVEGGKFKDR